MGEDGFGELRALLQQPSWDDFVREQVLALVTNAHEEDPKVYEETWLPYMQGFPHHWRAPLGQPIRADGLEAMARLLPHAYLRCGVSPDDASDVMRHLATSPHLERVRELSVFTHGEDFDAFATLMRASSLHRVTTLSLGMPPELLFGYEELNGRRYEPFDRRHMKALADAPALGAVRALKLYDVCRVDGGAPAALIHAPFFEHLTCLWLVSSLSSEGWTSMCSSWPMGLAELSLREHFGGLEEELFALSTCEGSCSLRRLDLSQCFVADETLTTLMRSPHLAGLRALSLERNRCIARERNQTDVSQLASFRGMWKHLSLDGTLFALEALEVLLNAPSTESLERLDLSNVTMTHDCHVKLCEVLARSPIRRTLRSLSIDSCHVGEEGVAALSARGPWPELRTLNAARNDITARALHGWVRTFPSLEVVQLARNPIEDEGLRALLECPNLRELYLVKCGLGPESAKALATSRPCELRWFHIPGNEMGEVGRQALVTSPWVPERIRRRYRR